MQYQSKFISGSSNNLYSSLSNCCCILSFGSRPFQQFSLRQMLCPCSADCSFYPPIFIPLLVQNETVCYNTKCKLVLFVNCS